FDDEAFDDEAFDDEAFDDEPFAPAACDADVFAAVAFAAVVFAAAPPVAFFTVVVLRRGARGFLAAVAAVAFFALSAADALASGVPEGVSFVSTSAVRSSGEEVTVLRYQWAASSQGPTRQSDIRTATRGGMQGGCRGCALRVYSVTKWQQGPLGPGLPRRNR
ncbi:hypothetical protein, partial [Microbacterium sp. PF5]|uniref:hypothetical protein n=1 Tax=Microbacterium sp. PF5 TaxID=2305435 RepID=UPI0014445B0D